MTRNKGEQSFHAFTTKYQPFLKKLAYGLSCSCRDHDQEDLYQELLIIAWEVARSDGYESADNPEKYMLASLRRRSLNLIRGDNSYVHVSLDRGIHSEKEDTKTLHEVMHLRNFSCKRNGLPLQMNPQSEEERLVARDLLQKAYDEADKFPNTQKGKIYKWVIRSLVRPPQALLNFANEREAQTDIKNRRSKTINAGAVGFEVCGRDTIQEYVGCGWRSVRTAIAKIATRLELDDDDE